ncbi:MerR family transcriptional regulator [Thermodesulfobacteriota bacterium]
MEQEVYTREDLAKAAGIAEEKVESLEKEGLFSPSGVTAGDVPFYKQDKLVEITKVLQLLDLGYGPGEVRKIVEKVGVPGTRRGRGSKGLYLTVGELAEKVGLGARTIKYWEEKGIIAPSTRSEGGFRLYQKDYVYIVQTIKDLQLFGYKLEDIKEVADLFRLLTSIREGSSDLGEEKALERLNDMKEKIKDLKSHTDQLKAGLRRWDRILEERRKEIWRVKEKIRRSLNEKKKKSLKTVKPGDVTRGNT